MVDVFDISFGDEEFLEGGERGEFVNDGFGCGY